VMLNIALEIDSVRSISELVQKGRGHTVMPLNAMRGPEGKGLCWQKIANPESRSRSASFSRHVGRRPHCLLKQRASRRLPCLICWSCRLKKSGAINLIHPSTLPHAGSHDRRHQTTEFDQDRRMILYARFPIGTTFPSLRGTRDTTAALARSSKAVAMYFA
jgi:hypothetical protein